MGTILWVFMIMGCKAIGGDNSPGIRASWMAVLLQDLRIKVYRSGVHGFSLVFRD